MLNVDVFEAEILNDPEPLAIFPITIPFGQVYVNKLKDDTYQCLLEGSSLLPPEFNYGCTIILNSDPKVKVQSEQSNIPGTFNITLDKEVANKIVGKLYNAFFIINKYLYQYKDWTSEQQLKYRRGEKLWDGCVERSQPINTIVKTLLVVDEAVEIWGGYTGDPSTIPETDYNGNILNEQEAQKRYKFWLECQEALSSIATKAKDMELSNPISDSEIAEAERTRNIIRIAASFDIKNKHLEKIRDDRLSNIWSTIFNILEPQEDVELEKKEQTPPTIPEQEVTENQKDRESEPSVKPKRSSKSSVV